MSDKAERQKRKAYLLSQIQQQRLDLSASRRDWLELTQRYDRGWNTLLSLRSWALVGSSVMAIWTIRHPNMLIRWARRGFGVCSSCASLLAGWRCAYPAYGKKVGRVRRSRHPAKSLYAPLLNIFEKD